MSIFKGCCTALITPFCEDMSVDFDALDLLIETQISAGINALTVLGTTAEPPTLTPDECASIVRFAKNRIGGRVPMIVGSGSNSTAKTIELSKLYQSMGADALLVVTPYYNRCSPDGLVAHYSAVASAVSVPIIAYNVPSRTNVNITPELASQLAHLPNIVAIKEASGNIEQISNTVRIGGLDVYSGDDTNIVPLIAVGGIGIISVISNLLPAEMVSICDNALRGDFVSARNAHFELWDLIKAIYTDVNPIGIKKAMEIANLCTGTLRLPLTPISPDKADQIREALAAYQDSQM